MSESKFGQFEAFRFFDLFDLGLTFLGSLPVNGNALKSKFTYDLLCILNSKQGRMCSRLGDTGLENGHDLI